MDRGAWWGYSPWGLQRLGHDLVIKPQERRCSETTHSSLYPFGSFSGLFSEAAKAQSEMFCDRTASDREENSMTHELLGFHEKQASGQRFEELFLFFKWRICKERPLHTF